MIPDPFSAVTVIKLTPVDTLVAQTVIVLKSVILSRTSNSTLPEPQKLVARLAKQLSGITNPKARASVYWLVGQFASDDKPPMHGIGWEGVAPWVPDILRNGVKGFVAEVRLPVFYRKQMHDQLSLTLLSRPLPSCKS